MVSFFKLKKKKLLSEQYLLQNDSLKQKSFLFPVSSLRKLSLIEKWPESNVLLEGEKKKHA